MVVLSTGRLVETPAQVRVIAFDEYPVFGTRQRPQRIRTFVEGGDRLEPRPCQGADYASRGNSTSFRDQRGNQSSEVGRNAELLQALRRIEGSRPDSHLAEVGPATPHERLV